MRQVIASLEGRQITVVVEGGNLAVGASILLQDAAAFATSAEESAAEAQSYAQNAATSAATVAASVVYAYSFKSPFAAFGPNAVAAAVAFVSARPQGGTVVLPEIDWVNDRTHVITADNVFIKGGSNSSTRIIRTADFGPDFKWAKPSGYINGGGISDVCFINNGTMTVANSPCSVLMDGLATGIVDNCRFLETIGAVHMLAASKIVNTRLFHFVSSGSPTGRKSMRVGASTNTNLTKQCSDIKISLCDFKGGGNPVVPCLDSAISVECTDGLWVSDCHFENTAVANTHLNTTLGDPFGNLYFSNNMHDISESPGILVSGNGFPSRLNIQGTCSDDSGAGTGSQHGLYVTGSVNLKNAVFDLIIDGYSGSAFKHDSTGSCEYSVALTATGNNVSGTAPLISIDQSPKITLLPGTIVDSTLTSTVLRTEASFAGTIIGTGLNCTATSGIYSDLSGGAGSVRITASPGLSDFEAKLTGTIASLANFASDLIFVSIPSAKLKSIVTLDMGADLSGVEPQAYMQSDGNGLIIIRNRSGATSPAINYSATFKAERQFR